MNKIAHVTVGLPIEGHFDYMVPPALQGRMAVGQRLLVPFRGKVLVGYCIGLAEKSFIKYLKPVSTILEEEPVLDQAMLNLTKEFADYYGCSWGEAIEAALPAVLRRGKPVENFAKRPEATQAGKSATTVVIDETQSKRWAFMAERIKEAVGQKRAVIFLVPEVAAIETAVSKLKENGCPAPIVLGKKMTAQQELARWQEVRLAQAPVVIGTRSAVFAPVADFGLIIVCDEENSSYKQEQTPAYHAREVALLRAQLEGAETVFVSCAPSAEVWYLAEKKKAELVVLKNEAPSAMQLLDLTNYKMARTTYISFPLQNQMEKVLKGGGKVLLFLNRRGFSTMTRCGKCDFALKCERCNIHLTYLYAKKILHCRLCGFETPLPKFCPKCKSAYLRSTGTGVEKIESELARIFPQARVARYDKETKGVPQNANIIVGTQAVLKLLDRLPFDLIGVLGFDAEINRHDFRSAQKAFSLLMHLRQSAKQKTIVQTRHIDSYALKHAVALDHKKFYKEEIAFRRELGFPPVEHLVHVALRGLKEEEVLKEAHEFYEAVKAKNPKGIEVLDPHPDVVPKLRDKYRFTIMLKGKSAKAILALVKSTLRDFKKKTIITVNVE